MSELIQIRQEDQRRRILGYLRMGATRKDAAQASGIDRVTLYRWIRDDRNFCNAVLQAEAECNTHMIAVITRAAAAGEWKAAAWFMERRDRQNWGQKLSVADLTNEQIIELLENEAEDGGDEAETASPVAGEGDPVDTVSRAADRGAEL